MEAGMQQRIFKTQKCTNSKYFSGKNKFHCQKAGLKLNIRKTKIMASSSITSWQIDGERMETVRDFIFGGSKIPADGEWSHEIKNAYSLEEKLWPT